jgi:hypothetical protein
VQPLIPHLLPHHLLPHHPDGRIDYWIYRIAEEIKDVDARKENFNVWVGWESPIATERYEIPIGQADETARKKAAHALVCRIDACLLKSNNLMLFHH